MQDDEIMTGEMLVETVENQLAEGNPIKVKETLMRLVMTGTPREEAIEMIACALSIEVFDVVKNDGEFNLKRYSENLDALPDMDWEIED
ncbi:hypothetical protein L6J37_06085 [Photobacterium sp. WH77]|uniref:Uncharacterized protein n=1 Tax=Photobacterium arenosum TaxID=2774143 RepID=A0ABR9BQB9_9GAMM|nr:MULTISPECIES: hypothetical protein [Photobacterium]MBD8513815.1 hypothetical protein [Photobacterium arenosum]MCG2836433.1 hypothetical protein [Photobacterium sp. WH77]MCG2843940.1 hypothetical protein [Photobacterium sp. WH80]MDO6581333.1 hypothetical protein [Photobacterium sp. 2_MG-2023]